MTDQRRHRTLRRRDLIVAGSLRRCASAFMVGAAYAAVPLYDWFCRATGFNGTTQVATAAPGRRARPQDHRALRRQRRPRPAVAVRARAELDRGQARRGRDRRTTASSTRRRATITGVGGLQRHAAQRRAPTSRRSTASASPSRRSRPARSATCRSCSTSIPRWRRTPTATTSTPSRCPTPSIRSASRRGRWRTARRRPGPERIYDTETDNGRRARQAAPRLPPGRSEPVAGRRLDLGLRDGGRRDHLDAPHVRRRAAGVRRRRDRRALHHARAGGAT